MRRFSVFSVLACLSLLSSLVTNAQNTYTMGQTPKTVTLCGNTNLHNFYDDGGPAAPYDSNYTDTLTFRSSLGTAGIIEVVFNDYFTNPTDTLFVFSGQPTTSLTALDTLEGNERAIKGSGFKYYSDNGGPSAGALTFIFVSGNTGPKNIGWVATVREATPCNNIQLVALTGGTAIENADTFKVCLGETLDFDAIRSITQSTVVYNGVTYTYAADPDSLDYVWTFSDGSLNDSDRTITKTFPTVGSYVITVTVKDSACCTYTRTFRVNVSPGVDFTGTSGDQQTCEGTTIQIVGNATGNTAGNVDGSAGYSYSVAIAADDWSGAPITFQSGNLIEVPTTSSPPGVYCYDFKVTDTYNCEFDSTVCVTVNPKVDAGHDTAVDACANTNSYMLFPLIDTVSTNGTGIWKDTDNSTFLTDANNGIVDLQKYTGLVPATFRYTYLVQGNPGCNDDSAVVTITIYPLPRAGTDNSTVLCNTETAFDLLALLATNQTNGTWDPDLPFSGTITNNKLDLTTGGAAPSPGPAGYVEQGIYKYRYIVGNQACPSDTAFATIDVRSTGVPGGSNSVNSCSGGPGFLLLDSLVGNKHTTGTWTLDAAVYSGTDPNYTFETSSPTGIYTHTYTVSRNSPYCADTSATLIVNHQQTTNAGTATSTSYDVCTSDNVFDLFTTITGHDTFGMWQDDDMTGALSGGNNEIIDLEQIENVIPSGLDTAVFCFSYIVASNNTTCPSDTETVCIRFTRGTNAGEDSTITACEAGDIFKMYDQLAGSPDGNGTWSGPGNYTPTDSSARFNPSTLGGSTFVDTYTVPSLGVGCPDATADLTIVVVEEPLAGDDNSDSACVSDVNYDLKPLRAGTFTDGGYFTLRGMGKPNPAWLSDDGIVNISSFPFPGCGVYEFEYHAVAMGCPEDLAVLTLDVKCLPDAGDDDSIYVCSLDPAFQVFPLMNTSDTRGTWDDGGSGGLTNGTGHDRTFDPSRVNTTDEYILKYTVDVPPCPTPDESELHVFLSRRPKAGLGSSDTVQACEDDKSFNLYELLAGSTFDQKGTWYIDLPAPWDPSINAEVNGNRTKYFKGADSNLLDVDTLVFYINNTTTNILQCSPNDFPSWIRFRYVTRDTTSWPLSPLCPDSMTYAFLEINKKFSEPTPKSVMAKKICETNSSFDLSTLFNNWDFCKPTGKESLTWQVTPPAGGSFDPAAIFNDHFLNAGALSCGEYSMTVTIRSGDKCQPITSQAVKIEIVCRPNAGTGATVSKCSVGDPSDCNVDLNTVINGEQTGGTWTQSGGPASQSFSPGGGFTVNVCQEAPGNTYEFTYTVTGTTCTGTSTSVARITVVAPPNPGPDQAQNVCEGTIVDLGPTYYPAIDPTGTFSCASCTNLSGTGYNATFDASPPAATPGASYAITYTLNNGVCPPVSSVLTLTITPQPRAGDDVSVKKCETGGMINLFSEITGTKTAGGTFGPPQSGLNGENFNPLARPGFHTFIYTVSADGCPDDQSTISLEVEKRPVAGSDGTIEVCSDDNQVDLFAEVLQGPRDPGGNWINVAGGTAVPGGVIDPTVLTGTGPFTFEYTVEGDVCPDDKATATVRIIPRPKSGRADTTITICSSEDLYNLFNAIGVVNVDYDQGGTWRDCLGVTLSSGSFIRPNKMPFDTTCFTYTVTKPLCTPSVTTVTVIISPQPNAGKDGSVVACSNGPDVDLNRVITQFSPGGRWELHSGTPNAGSYPGNLFLVSSSGLTSGDVVFRYIVESPACMADTAYATVKITKAPNAGSNVTQSLCNLAQIDLNTLLTGQDANGTWTKSTKPGNNNDRVSSTALAVNIFRPSVTGPGKYVFNYTVTANGCPDAVAEVTLNVFSPGRDTTVEFCNNMAQVDLNALTGTSAAELGTNWNMAPPIDPGVVTTNIFRPNRAVVDKQYTVTLTTPFPAPFSCSPKAVITVREALGITNKVVDCLGDGTYRVSFTLRGGTPGKYTVLPANSGTLSVNGSTWSFLSNPIVVGATYNFTIQNEINCGDFIVRGSSVCEDHDNDGKYDDVDLDDDNDGVPDLAESFSLVPTDDDDADGLLNHVDATYCSGVGSTLNNFGVCRIFDNDDDGVINQFDLDSDGDGIADIFEGFGIVRFTNDGNGRGTGNDLVGNDGWIDTYQGAFSNLVNTDAPADTVPDIFDTDSDNDGIPDSVEGQPMAKVGDEPRKTDSDPEPDYMDTDSDDDKVCDKWEAGSDGSRPVNSDNEGEADYRETDADADGINDQVEARLTGGACSEPEDFDGDGTYNFQDWDSDGDLISDKYEANGQTPPRNSGYGPAGTLPDYLNLDTDFDGICDSIEGHEDGIDNVIANSDNDNLEDYRDRDSDNDLIPDAFERGLGSGCDPADNHDNDRLEDFRDVDSDNDGLSDNFEAGIVPTVPVNSDEDSLYNYQDPDSDNDCIPDQVEAIAVYDGFAVAWDTAYAYNDGDDLYDYIDTDSDGDGILDEDEAGPDCGNPVNSDYKSGDLFPDFRDLDSDGDGVSDKVEKDADCDGDGRPNFQDAGDNCEIATFVPEGFSPNGDGVNDFFVIPDITEFPAASLKVFNRWGAVVFESSAYNNRWDGTYKGEDLPSGTYFYLLDLGIGNDAQKGYVYINR